MASLEFATGAKNGCTPSTSRGKCARAGRRRHALLHGGSLGGGRLHAHAHRLVRARRRRRATTSFVRAGAVGASGAADASLNEILLAPPAALTLPPAAVTATVAGGERRRHRRRDAEGERHRALRDADDGGAGRFTDNAFAVTAAAAQVVQFVPFDGFDKGELERTLRVEHLAGAALRRLTATLRIEN